MTTPASSSRPDAVRNRALILDAARGLVARHGPQVGMEQIAGDAGLAVGTLYRHFPTKEALLGAVVEEKVHALVAAATEASERVEAGGDAWTELHDLFWVIAQRAAEDRAVKSAMAAVSALPEGDLAEAEQHAIGLLEDLMRRAQQDRTMRADVTATDVAWLLQGVPGVEADEQTRQRCAQVVLDGLRGPGR